MSTQTTKRGPWTYSNGVAYTGWDGDREESHFTIAKDSDYGPMAPYRKRDLIASAPALLEALEAALVALNDSAQGAYDGGKLTTQISIALAAAKGGD